MSWERVRPDATNLRGLAHPLRVKMLTLLRSDGPATATLLAQRLGQSSGVTSYHLRQLAQYGFVVEDPDRNTGRERWWKSAHHGTVLEGDIAREAPAETEAYLRAIAALYADRVDHWLSELPVLTGEWEKSPTLSDMRLRLTPGEARELHDAINTLIEGYRRDNPDETPPPGAEPVVVQWQIMPFLRSVEPSEPTEPADQAAEVES